MFKFSKKFLFLIIVWPCLKRTGNDQIQKLDWLKLILTLQTPTVQSGDRLVRETRVTVVHFLS